MEAGITDDDVVRLALESDKCAIDAPFGWPEPFVEFVRAHRSGDTLPSGELRLRTTDLAVRQTTGIRPLSVSANLIGATAMRCARLLRSIGHASGQPVDRTGVGLVVEAYPAAALNVWGLPSTGLKGGSGRVARDTILAALLAATGAQTRVEDRRLLTSNDDAFESLVCGLVARAAAIGNTEPTPDAEPAATEGWIHLPKRGSSIRATLGLA